MCTILDEIGATVSEIDDRLWLAANGAHHFRIESQFCQDCLSLIDWTPLLPRKYLLVRPVVAK